MACYSLCSVIKKKKKLEIFIILNNDHSKNNEFLGPNRECGDDKYHLLDNAVQKVKCSPVRPHTERAKTTNARYFIML